MAPRDGSHDHGPEAAPGAARRALRPAPGRHDFPRPAPATALLGENSEVAYHQRDPRERFAVILRAVQPFALGRLLANLG